MDQKYQKFEDFDLSKKLQEAVMDARLERPTDLQKEVIPLALANKDVLFEARSGMGKSACFAIPFIQHWLRDRERKALIVTPTADSVQQLAKVIGRLCPSLKARVLKFTAKDDYFFPEFHEKCPIVILEFAVADRFIKREKEYVAQVRSLGIDELDRLLDSQKELEELVQSLNAERQTLISANELTEQVLEKGRWFCDPNRLEKVKLSRPEAQWSPEQVKLQYVVVNDRNRFYSLRQAIETTGDKVVMILTDSDRISRFVAEDLSKKDINAGLLEYSMQLDAKQEIANQITGSGKGVLVGCEAALNGLNLPKIDHLISWELPSQLENYWKRLDRFTFQGELTATVMVDEPRRGAVRILERRLGRPMIELTFEAAERKEPAKKEPVAKKPPQRPEKKEEMPKMIVVDQERAPDKLIIPDRYKIPVFAEREELVRFAPKGIVKKTLGSKFLPSRSKKKVTPVNE